MKRTAALLTSLPLMFWIAQGCSSTSDTTGGGTTAGDDGGGTGGEDGGTSGPGTDGGSGGSKDSGKGGDAGTVVQTTPGTSLVSGKGITLYGVTADGYVVFGKDTGKTDDAGAPLTDLEVISIAGGTATVLAPVLNFAVDDFAIAGKTIAYYKNVDQNTGIAASLSVWSAANAALKQVATNSLDGLYDASEDGTHVVFSQNVDGAKNTADLVVSKADGTTPVPFITQFSLANCSPDVGFRKAIVYGTACTGAVKTASIATLDTGNAAATVTKTAGTVAKPGFASMDADGTHLLYIKNTNLVGTVATFDGKTPIAHDQNTAFAALNTDGTKLVYRTTLADGGAGELATSPAATNTPTVLVPTVFSVLGVAPDFSNAVVNLKAVDQATNKDIARADLNFASLATAGAPKNLTAAGLPVGFNSTGSHFFFLTDLPTTGKTPIATLNAHAAAGGTDKVIAKNIISPKIVDTTTKAVYMENIQFDAAMNPYIDLTVGDGAGAGAPTVVVQGADPGFELSGTKLVYTNATKGLYVVAVP